MKNLVNYIESLDFEYAISYSGLRGDKFRKLKLENIVIISQLKEKIQSARFLDIPKLNLAIEKLENETRLDYSRSISKDGRLHKSTEIVHQFTKNDKNIESIFEILKQNYDVHAVAACSPVFRDAIAFYSKEQKIVGILHICFSCAIIINEVDEQLNADCEIYTPLKNKLIQLGHQVED